MVRIKTTLTGFGPITATGSVQLNPDRHEYGESKYLVLNLTVKNALGIEITTDLEDYEQEEIEDQLIQEYNEEAGRYQDGLIDEAIARGRELAHTAYA